MPTNKLTKEGEELAERMTIWRCGSLASKAVIESARSFILQEKDLRMAEELPMHFTRFSPLVDEEK